MEPVLLFWSILSKIVLVKTCTWGCLERSTSIKIEHFGVLVFGFQIKVEQNVVNKNNLNYSKNNVGPQIVECLLLFDNTIKAIIVVCVFEKH